MVTAARIFCAIGIIYAAFLLYLTVKTTFKKRKEEIQNAEECLKLERKIHYSYFLQRNLTQAVNDLYFRINEPKFNSDDLIYVLNKNGLYLVDVDTFDQSYDKGEGQISPKSFVGNAVIGFECKSCGWKSHPGATISQNKEKTCCYCPKCKHVLDVKVEILEQAFKLEEIKYKNQT